jgi:hypothetical protein
MVSGFAGSPTAVLIPATLTTFSHLCDNPCNYITSREDLALRGSLNRTSGAQMAANWGPDVEVVDGQRGTIKISDRLRHAIAFSTVLRLYLCQA